jgi:cold shock CspA family protein
MRGEHFYGHLTQRKPVMKGTRPGQLRGCAETGQIVKLEVGRGHGFIRIGAGRSDRDIYFHRSDVQQGASINDFGVGDRVQFELLEDHVSGARALRVHRC